MHDDAKVEYLLNETVDYSHWYADPDDKWRLRRRQEDGAFIYETQGEYGAATLIIHNPLNLVAELRIRAKQHYEAAISNDAGEVVLGTSVGDYLEPAIDGMTAGAVHMLHVFLGNKAANLIQDAIEDAAAVAKIATDVVIAQSVEDLMDITVSNKFAAVDEVITAHSKRDKEQLRAIISKLPPRGKGELLLARAIRTMRETSDNLDLEDLARLLTEKYKYEPPITGEALGKAFARKSGGWKSLKKNGQK